MIVTVRIKALKLTIKVAAINGMLKRVCQITELWALRIHIL